MNGFITLERKFLEWEWFDEPNTFRVFIFLLLKANHKNNSWRGFSIKRGQLITGRKSLAKSLNLSEQNIRTALKNLQLTNEITIEPTNEFSLVTIVKYGFYQDLNRTPTNQPTNETTNQLTNNQPTPNQPLTNVQPQRNNENNENNVNNDNKSEYSENFTPTGFSKIFNKKIEELYNVDLKKIKTAQTEFLKHYVITGKKWKHEQDLNEHFLNWFKKKLEKEKNTPKNEKVGERQDYN